LDGIHEPISLGSGSHQVEQIGRRAELMVASRKCHQVCAAQRFSAAIFHEVTGNASEHGDRLSYAMLA
jgi:hypothetical protein